MARYVLVVLRYRVPLARIEESTARHRAYLRELHTRGKLVASGPFDPREGGALLMRVADREELDAILASDPFHQEALVESTAHFWSPTLGLEGLDAIAKI